MSRGEGSSRPSPDLLSAATVRCLPLRMQGGVAQGDYPEAAKVFPFARPAYCRKKMRPNTSVQGTTQAEHTEDKAAQ